MLPINHPASIEAASRTLQHDWNAFRRFTARQWSPDVYALAGLGAALATVLVHVGAVLGAAL